MRGTSVSNCGSCRRREILEDIRQRSSTRVAEMRDRVGESRRRAVTTNPGGTANNDGLNGEFRPEQEGVAKVRGHKTVGPQTQYSHRGTNFGS